MIKGPKEANLVVSFRSQRSAADAVELGRGNSKGLEWKKHMKSHHLRLSIITIFSIGNKRRPLKHRKLISFQPLFVFFGTRHILFVLFEKVLQEKTNIKIAFKLKWWSNLRLFDAGLNRRSRIVGLWSQRGRAESDHKIPKKVDRSKVKAWRKTEPPRFVDLNSLWNLNVL